MPFTDQWDVTTPADTQLAALLGQDIRNLKLDIQQRMGVISGLSTMMPPLATDAQPANWTGLLFFATDNGHIYQWSGSTWVDVTTNFLNSNVIGNASAVTGVTILGSAIEAGAVINAAFSIVQPPASPGSTVHIGGTSTTLFGTSGASQIDWYIWLDLFFDAVGSSGHVGGQFRAAGFGTNFIAGAIQDFLFNTSAFNFSIAAVLGSGSTAGPITATLHTP